MGQHIVLTFLSTVRTETPDNGMVEAQETSYSNVSGETTRTTNESALRYLMEKLNGEKIARIFVFASEKVREEGFVSAELGGKKVTLESVKLIFGTKSTSPVTTRLDDRQITSFFLT